MEASSGYRRDVGYGEAVQLFFSNYINFEGRSNRGEYWKAVLCLIGVSILLSLIDAMLFSNMQLLSSLFSLATLVPGIAIGVRRLHDIGKSGWWYLLILVPVIGVIVLIVWFAKTPEPGPNQYG
ncbi:hypothetical protein AVJ23_09490 [Pseudoponticoccus marisrubri]|uniref:DUF805 domain-containing protein n=2 Tax=Pseudoponticoccus marisrubri TaxID=1685382 RepID=A0A0W7WL66_9RHOB|nr:hypothetical protein AVJ23_09490 [Pseudoponticoccus marisrubri]